MSPFTIEPVPAGVDRPLWSVMIPTYNCAKYLGEALRSVLSEGLEARWERHADAAAHLQAAVESRGLELLADADHRLAPLTAVRVPEGVDGKAVQGRMLREHGIEIGGGLGPAAPAGAETRRACSPALATAEPPVPPLRP